MQNYAWVFLDLLSVFVIVYFIGVCASKGFVQTVVGFLSYIIAALVAATISTPIANSIYNYTLHDTLVRTLTNSLEEVLSSGTASVAQVLEQLPSFIKGIIQLGGVNLAQDSLEGEIGSVVAGIIDSAIKTPLISLLRGIVFFLLFWVVLFILRRFSRFLGGLRIVPIIGTLNSLLGALLGAVEAIVFLFLLAVILQLIIVVTSGSLSFLNNKIIDDSYIFRFFCQY